MNYVVYALRAGMALQAWTAIPAMLYDYHREHGWNTSGSNHANSAVGAMPTALLAMP